jgi:hypothetical protein
MINPILNVQVPKPYCGLFEFSLKVQSSDQWILSIRY